MLPLDVPVRALKAAARLGGFGGRQIRARDGRFYVEVHGLDQPHARRVIRTVERTVGELPGVRWARVNAPTHRVVVDAASSRSLREDDLVRAVAQAERDAAVPAECDDECEDLHHPCEGPRTTQSVTALAADALGLGLSAVTRLGSWVPLPTEVAAIGSVFHHHPTLRRLTGKALHSQHDADAALPVVSALAQGLAAGGEGIVLDVVQRIEQWREARAHQDAWWRREPDLVRDESDAAADPVPARENPPRADPADDYARRAMSIGATAGAAAVPFTGPRQGLAVGLASLPKAPAAGREGFATHIGRVLAQRGVVVMDRSVLRQLGRMDTVVIDAAAMRGGRHEITDLIPVANADPAEIAEVGFDLFQPDTPGARQERDGWVLAPLDDLELSGTTGRRAARQLRERGADRVLGIARGRKLRGVAGVSAEQTDALRSVIAAARRVRAAVVVADGKDNDRGQAQHPYADDVIPGGDELPEQVRDLQRDGAVTVVVSNNQKAVAAADCGLGLHRDGEPPPWGAHLLLGEDAAATTIVIDAIDVAATVDDQSMTLAAGGSGVGAVAALQGTGARAASRGMLGVNAAAAAAFAGGRWRSRSLLSRPAVAPEGSAPWHLMPADTALARLGSDPDGLSAAEAEQRARTQGDGDAPVGVSLWQAFADELANPLTPVLAAGAALSAATGSLTDAGLVAAVTGASTVMGGMQRVRTDRALGDLLRQSAAGVTVRRDGTEHYVATSRLVPGDVVVLGHSDVVPADCRIIEADELEVDESSLSGESLPVAKSPAPVAAADIGGRTSMLYEGTTISVGHAVAVVVATGTATVAGRSMAVAAGSEAPPGSGARLDELTKKGTPLAIGGAATVAAAGLSRGVPLSESLGTAVNLAVASVPEGLPFVRNAAQLASARRLADQGALVRDPRTLEALGRADVLCFDKTGTLTRGTLSLTSVGDTSATQDVEELDDAHRAVLAAALRATPGDKDPDELEHATDRGVVAGAREAGVDAHTDARDWRRGTDLPFEPSRGYHATVGDTGSGCLLSVKGAPEVVLPRCTYADSDGRHVRFGDRARKAVSRTLDCLAGQGHRVLVIAERTLDTSATDDTGRDGTSGSPEGARDIDDDAVTDLVYRGFVALADPVRTSAAPAAAQLRRAGVQVVMLTGDHPATADAIATTVNGGANDDVPTATSAAHVVTGPELAELDDEQLADRLRDVDVIARCSPKDKVRIIQALRSRGRTVAMTGDGANDAPAIRLADVGIALGRRGTPAARTAADVVVTDDQLATITAALLEGRALWSSVRDALAILLGGNLGEVSFSVLASLLTGRSPLTARQILLVNLLTDLAPAVAIALREPRRDEVDGLLSGSPTSALGSQLNRELVLRAVVTTLGATAGWGAARLTGRRQRAATVALASLVGTQLGQTLAIGGLDRRVLLASIGSALVLGGAIQTPGVSQFFGCTPLGPVGWSIALGASTSATVLGVIGDRLLHRVCPALIAVTQGHHGNGTI
ncbi:cation-translocating P-type ATPase [Haloechinothrix salitolerans]|uniref:HAD-IC family P-type ATPase n=1 Tax=Haloechinothrix salitolerans TaxID=926830 RepID=A0ABW2C2Y9_9PSEU